MSNEIPRRICLNRMTPAELAIRNAVLAVEELPADERLTAAVILLSQAQDKVADYVDRVEPTPRPGSIDMRKLDGCRYGCSCHISGLGPCAVCRCAPIGRHTCGHKDCAPAEERPAR